MNRMNHNNRNLTNIREYVLTATQHEIEENNINQISTQSNKKK